MDITGLTGHSGSGKTTVANIMAGLGFYHIDCDKIVHTKVYTDKNVLKKISDSFGNEFVTDGILDRKRLGALIFSEKAAYDKLMNVVGDDIKKAVNHEIENNKDKHILLDAPTLFEFGMDNICTRIIGVISNEIIDRICKRDNISIQDAKLRLSNQKSADFFKNNCDIIIKNNKDLKHLEENVTKIALEILKG